MGRPVTTRTAAALTGAYALFFVLLAIDVAVRIVTLRAGFDSTLDAMALVLGELVRAAVGVIIIVIGVRLASTGLRAGTRALGFMMLFLDIWYLKSFAGSFPGAVQERIADFLNGIGTPRRALIFVFGDPIWALWLALAAFIWFALTFPRPVSPADVVAAGAADRRGAMRSVALAGVDVGAAFRRNVSAMIDRGLLRPAVVWPSCAIAGVAHALMGGSTVVEFIGWLLLGAFAGIGITALRAGRAVADPLDVDALMWLQRGVLVSAVAGLAFAALSLVSFAEPLAFVVFVAAPAVAASCVVLAASMARRAEILNPPGSAGQRARRTRS